MGVFSSIKSIQSIGEVVAVAAAGIAFQSIPAILFSYLSFHIVLSVIVLLTILREVGLASPKFDRMDQYLRFGIPLVATSMMYWVVNVSDRYLITYFHTIEATGGYAIVYATASGLTVFSMAIGTVLFPELSDLQSRDNRKEYRQRLNNVLRYYFVISVPATVGLMAVSTIILRLLSSDAISEYTNLMYILAPAMLAYGLFNILIQALLSDGNSRSTGMIWSLIALVNLGANLILIPTYSAMGASISTLGSFLLGLTVVLLWKREDIQVPLMPLGKVALSSTIMGFSVLFVKGLIQFPNIIGLLALIGFGILIYVLMGLLSGFLDKEDAAFLIDAIRG